MKQLHQLTTLSSVLVLGVSSLVACSSDDPGTGGNTGGFLGSGGGGVTGTGAVPNGGTTTTGGAGGGPANGGVTGTTGGVTGTTGGVTGTTGGATGNGGATASGGATGNGGTTGGNCDPAGKWAILFEVGIGWQAKGVLTCPAAGCTGKQQLKLLSTRTYDAATGNITDSAQICGVTIPSFTTIVGEIKVLFPDAVWDKQPVITTLLSKLTGTPAPGAAFASENNAIVVGATLADAANAAWPAPTAVVAKDDDGDSNPGVTATSPDPGAPTSVLGPNADQLYLAFRTIAKVNGTQETCDKSSGKITLKGVEQGILGCHIKSPDSKCDATQTKFLNDNSPVWQAGTDSKLVQIRVDAAKTCADVRTMTF